MTFRHLISGFDTIECAYYLIATYDYKLDFIELAAQKVSMVRAKVTKPSKVGCAKRLICTPLHHRKPWANDVCATL